MYLFHQAAGTSSPSLGLTLLVTALPSLFYWCKAVTEGKQCQAVEKDPHEPTFISSQDKVTAQEMNVVMSS